VLGGVDIISANKPAQKPPTRSYVAPVILVSVLLLVLIIVGIVLEAHQ
jgi:hypothetical protein